MLRIVIIRPGSSDFEDVGRIQGTLNIPLSPQGSSEVAQMLGELSGAGIEMLYSSPCQPALQTAEQIAAGLNVKLKPLDGMQNLDHGLWQGMLIDDVRRKQPKVYRQWQEQPETVCPPEGEMLGQAADRIRTAMTRLLKRHKQGVIGLVLPEPLATLVRCFIKHEALGDLWKAATEHQPWEILEVASEQALTPSR
jgi:probable phosphoglycerate mutase